MPLAPWRRTNSRARSCRASRQRWVSAEELVALSPWFFRFKRAAGAEWLALDPFWQGEPPLRLSFLPDGSYVRAGPEGESRGGWRLVRTVGTGQRGPLGSFLRLTVDAFSAGRSEIGHWQNVGPQPPLQPPLQPPCSRPCSPACGCRRWCSRAVWRAAGSFCWRAA